MSVPAAKKLRFDSPATLDPAPASAPALYEPSPPQPGPSSSKPPPPDQAARPKRQAPVHGNFFGYYTKRPRVGDGDERLRLVPREWVTGKRVLDVGSNAGVVTVELAQAFGAAQVVGVDIDEQLVTLAKRHSKLSTGIRVRPSPSQG